MKITVLTLQAFIVGLVIGGFYGDALGIRSATESRTVETLEATVATQTKTLAKLKKQVETQQTIIATQAEVVALLEARDRVDLPAIPFEFEAPE